MPAIQLDEKEIFNVARKIESPELRSEYLRQVTADDNGLLQRITALLRGFEKQKSFLEQPALHVDETANPERDQVADGTRIGPYKLREPIGEGGMGVVYVAEQERPVRRKVALKLIKPGKDTKEVIARFAAERQALAMMDHPNIARVLDAGTTAGGRPYFVMELVRGISITDYCDKAKLTTRERLGLFVTVCRAVQHAHQKGIIHRDIKPSNVLITQHDGVPVVKVIDFGLAKALHESFQDASVYTGFHQMLGTPRFMSPEQAEMSGLDVDTRSDIYSLGVLLYVLLTGRTPLDSDSEEKPSFDELRRQIREVTPPKPSARFSTMKNAELSTVAQQRRIDPQRLSRELRGDLDWIVMKALEKDRNRRYETANAFAEDVKRYLNSEPVKAAAPSMLYLLRKTLSRHRAALATAASFLALLLTSTVVSGLLAVQANREAEKSQKTASELEGAVRTVAAARDREQALREQVADDRDRALAEAYAKDIPRAYLNAQHSDGNEQVPFDLAKWIPLEGQIDRRGWEWYLLNSRQFSAELFLNGHSTAVMDIASSPDAKRLVSIGEDGLIVLWDLETGTRLSSHLADDVGGTSVAWSPSGQQFATAGLSGKITLWTADGTARIRTLDKHRDQVNAIAYSPNGDRLVSGSDDTTAIVWNVETGEVISTFDGHSHEIDSVNWHPDGQQVVSTSEKGKSVSFWDPTTAQEIAPAIEDTETDGAAWRQDGKFLVTAEAGWPTGRFVIRDGVTHEPIEVRTTQTVNFARWNKSGQSLATSHPWGGIAMIQMWDEKAQRPTRAFTGHTFGIAGLIWIDDDRVATCSADHTIRIWNFNPRELRTYSQQEALESVRLSPDAKLLAALPESEQTVRILRSHRGESVCELNSGDKIAAIAWAPDSRRLATWSFHDVIIWDTQTGQPLMKFDTDPVEPHWAGDRSLEWNPGGNYLLTAVFAKLMIWDTATGKKVHDIEDVPGLVKWSPDGYQISTIGGSMDQMTVLELSGSQEPKQRTLPFGDILAWSPDGLQFATAEDSGRIRNAQTGEEVLRFDIHSRSDRVTAICWHPDGTRVATGSSLGTVRVWNSRTGQELLTLREHAEPINSIEFSHDGTRLVSSGDDGKINVWDATSGYARFGSDHVLEALHREGREGTLDADGWQLCGRLHAATGDWEQSGEDYQRAVQILGSAAPKWFVAGQWVIGPYPANLQQAYPPEQQETLNLRQPLPGVAGGSEIPEARDLRWQFAEPSFDQGVNLSMHVGSGELISAYALTRVYAPREVKVAVLMGAARFDEHRLWHNGKMIYEDLQGSVAGRWPDEGCIAVKLTPGWNTFLAKVVNIPFRERPFFLYFRLSDDPAFLTRAYVQMNDASEALAALNQFLLDDPEDPQLYYARAVAHLRLGNPADAKPDLRRATDELGDLLVARLFREAELADPVEILTSAIALTPDNMELKALCADQLCHEARWKEALEVERELAKSARFASRAENLTLLLAVCGENEEYQRQRQVLLKRIEAGEDDGAIGAADQQQIIACLVMPMTSSELEQISNAYEWYPVLAVAALADPYNRSQKRIEGLLEYRRANYDKAIELLSDAAQYDPKLSEPWMVRSARRRAATSSAYLAMALHRTGRVSEAKTMLQQARDLFEQRDRNYVGSIYTEIALEEAQRLLEP